MRACRTLETVPGGRSFGRAGLAMPFVGTGVGCMVVSPERSPKGFVGTERYIWWNSTQSTGFYMGSSEECI